MEEENVDWMKNAEWVKNHLDGMNVDSYWSPDGMGFLLKKVEDKKLVLVRCINHYTVLRSISGLKTLAFDLGYTVSDSDIEFDDVPESSEDAQRINDLYKQIIVDNWKCESCGFPIVEMDASNVFPTLIETTEMLDEDGNVVEYDWWGMILVCPSCGHETTMTIENFTNSHGEVLVHRIKDGNTIYQAHTRQVLVDMVESGEYDASKFCLLGSTSPSGEKIPMWMQGQYCEMIVLEDGEEE